MKKITQIAETGGARIDFNDFRDVFNLEMWDVMESIFSPFDNDTEGIIVEGCTISGSVGNYTISSGIVYLDGEFRRFSSQAGLSLPQYIKASSDSNTTRTFEDGNTKTLFITKSADLTTSAPGSGQYIAFTSTTDANDRRWAKPALGGGIKFSDPVEIGDWNMDLDETKGVNFPAGITASRIRGIFVKIRDDQATPNYYDFKNPGGIIGGSYTGTGIYYSDVISGIALSRQTGGIFDNNFFDSTSYNRGWVTFMYV